jgi:steroid delta-isomerase-like uncharacterized protein
MSPKQVVARYLGEVLGGESPPEQVVSDVELARRTERLRRAFPDLELEVVALVAEDKLVAAHAVARGTHTALYQGVPPTGRTVEVRCTGVYRVERGRIADSWVTWDHLSLLEQLGAVERVATVSA